MAFLSPLTHIVSRDRFHWREAVDDEDEAGPGHNDGVDGPARLAHVETAVCGEESGASAPPEEESGGEGEGDLLHEYARADDGVESCVSHVYSKRI